MGSIKFTIKAGTKGRIKSEKELSPIYKQKRNIDELGYSMYGREVILNQDITNHRTQRFLVDVIGTTPNYQLYNFEVIWELSPLKEIYSNT